MRNKGFSGSYEEGLNHQYYVVQRELDLQFDKDKYRGEQCCEQMILNNSIEGILPLRAEVRNNEKRYIFCTDGLRSLYTICGSGRLKGDFISTLITRIISVVVDGAEYFLEENDYIIEPEAIFVSSEEGRVCVVYVPGYNVDLRTQLLTLLEFLMENLDYNDRRAAYITYSIYGKCKRDGITLDELRCEAEKWSNSTADIDDDLKKEKESAGGGVFLDVPSEGGADTDDDPCCENTQSVPRANSGYMSEVYDCCSKSDDRPNKRFISDLFIKVKNKLVKVIKEFGGGKDDMSIQEQSFHQNQPSLSGGGMTVYLESLPFFVGRMKKQCDLYIDSDEVSRFHARIGRREGAFYVVDLGSEKGTFLNGIILEPGLEEPIMSGDELMFGNEEYVFDDGET